MRPWPIFLYLYERCYRVYFVDIRITGMLQYFFYKNMMLTLALLYYSFYMGFTGQTLYDSWTLSLWNVVFTLVPPFTYGLFEKDVDDTTIYKVYTIFDTV
jgi:magnesium-transporting ATPase (P-type)